MNKLTKEQAEWLIEKIMRRFEDYSPCRGGDILAGAQICIHIIQSCVDNKSDEYE